MATHHICQQSLHPGRELVPLVDVHSAGLDKEGVEAKLWTGVNMRTASP